MTAGKVLIADNDLEYAKALARAVSGLQNEYEIAVIRPGLAKSAGAVRNLISGYDLVLLDGCFERTLQASKSQISNCRIALLSESVVETLVEQSKKEAWQFWQIYKYTNVYEIISDINFLTGSLTGRKSLTRKRPGPGLIGFYSISGGSGKSVVAISTLRELSRCHDKKTLYLCFEEIPATELFVINNSGRRNIGDYLYYLFERKNEALCSRPEAFTACDDFGVEYLYPSKGRNDLTLLTRNEMIFFLKTVSESCRYDYIALDLKNDLSEGTLFLMNLCNEIIFIRSENRVSELKSRKCMDYLLLHNALENTRQILSVVNRAAGPEDERDNNPGVLPGENKEIYIEEDGSSFRYAPDYIDVAIDHNFGVGIKKIADRILLAENTTHQKGRE